MVALTLWWGNDDAQSTIELPEEVWRRICEGAAHAVRGTGWYEGIQLSVLWKFERRTVSVFGDDGATCLEGSPIEEIEIG